MLHDKLIRELVSKETLEISKTPDFIDVISYPLRQKWGSPHLNAVQRENGAI